MSKKNEYKDLIEAGPAQSSKESDTKVSASSAQTLVSDPLADSARQADANGTNFLGSLLHATIFFTYFEHVASKTYKGNKSEQKVVKLKSVHPYFHGACIILDLIIMSLAVGFLIFVAGGAAWKVVWG